MIFKNTIYLECCLFTYYTMASQYRDCEICAFPTNSKTKKEISCPYCNFVCCKQCVCSYLLSTAYDTPRCMNPSCEKEWTADFLSSVTPNSFHNQKYRDHCASILLSQEKSMLPTTQEAAQRHRQARENKKIIDDLLGKKRELQNQINKLSATINQLRWPNRYNGIAPREEKKEKKEFIRNCPVEDCRGFLSTQWKCGLCETWACSHCHGIKEGKNDETHVCNKDEVETAKLLKKDTKACPKCAVPIFRIHGCSQMFCTSCHTPFDWNTLEVITRNFHNPHFYEWQRQQNGGVAPRVWGDNPCGGLPRVGSILGKFPETKRKEVSDAHRLINHTEYVVMMRYPTTFGPINNQDIRIKYILGDISEERWKSLLKKRSKQQDKNHSVNQILNVFVRAATDIFQKMARGSTRTPYDELLALREYVNGELVKVKERFKNKVPHITNTWKIQTK